MLGVLLEVGDEEGDNVGESVALGEEGRELRRSNAISATSDVLQGTSVG